MVAKPSPLGAHKQTSLDIRKPDTEFRSNGYLEKNYT